MEIINKIKNLFRKKQKEKGTGAVDDPRTEIEKQKDYQAEELAAFAPIEWKEKPENEWRKFPIFNQDGSLSCVAQSISKALGINNYLEEGQFLHLSARDLYTRRANKPSGGMWGQDACEIARIYGATIESLMPSQEISEQLMNNAVDRTPSKEIIGRIFRAKNWLALPFDIDAIASIIAHGKPVVLFFRWASYEEWDRPDPKIIGGELKYHHAICGVDFTLYQGKKVIVIEDSWGANKGINGQRVITEEWFKSENNRITWASYFEDLSNLEILNSQIEKPKYNFTQELRYGMKNSEVAMLQKCLGYLKDAEGYLFPLSQEPTGYFGGVTLKAIKRYQAMKSLPQTGVVDRQTIEQLNKDFN